VSRLLSGRAFDSLVVDELLANGGMAEIYAARHGSTAVVVKRVHPHLARDPDFVAMFEDEIRITARLRHRGIVAVLDVLRPPDEVLLVLERVDGVDLRTELTRAHDVAAPLDIAAVLSCMHHVAEALAYVHSATDDHEVGLGIVHRDISPGNLMARAGGGACILDFGVARAAARVAKTTGSITKGKPSYLSPEQASMDAVGPLSDVYQLGLVLFELLTGQRALVGRSPLDLMRAAVRPIAVPPSTLRADVVPELDELVRAMRAIDPRERPTAERVAAALLGFRDHPGMRSAADLGAEQQRREAVARRDRALELAAGLDDDDTQPIRTR